MVGNFTVLPILLRSSGQTITFAPGSWVTAQPGAFHGLNDCLFSADGVENLTIIGYGATWAMRRRDYNDTAKYEHSEWRHALSIMSSDTVSVRGVHIAETGGDGVYLALVRSVELRDVTTDGAYRNGLSIISASQLLVMGWAPLCQAPPALALGAGGAQCRPHMLALPQAACARPNCNRYVPLRKQPLRNIGLKSAAACTPHQQKPLPRCPRELIN